jgi:hypothetical protein
MPRPRKGEAGEYGPGTKLSDEVSKQICDMLELTVPLTHAAGKVGVHRVTVSDWMARGEAGEEPYATFAHNVMVAKSKAVCNLTVMALKGGKGSGHALFFLQKRYPADFPIATQRLEHTGVDGGSIEISSLQTMSDERLSELAARLATRKPPLDQISE